jgi:hypothetical protein
VDHNDKSLPSSRRLLLSQFGVARRPVVGHPGRMSNGRRFRRRHHDDEGGDLADPPWAWEPAQSDLWRRSSRKLRREDPAGYRNLKIVSTIYVAVLAMVFGAMLAAGAAALVRYLF